MPISYEIDHDRRLVTASARGTLTHEDVFGYQQEVWSRADLAAYDELIDMSEVGRIALDSTDDVRKLAQLSASMDGRSPGSALAILAPNDFAFALGRMFEIYRGLDDRSTKRVGVFRTMADALAFLRREDGPPAAV